jgi:ribulose-phosphate 3-epimerase
VKKVSISIHAIENFTTDILKGLKGLDYIHVDVFDGKFVNNKHDNVECFKMLKKYTNIPVIAHLMVIDPYNYVDKIIDFVDIFEFHYEAEGNKQLIIDEVIRRNKKVGIVVNPDTPISKVVPLLKDLDLVLVMSVIPGWSGQKFIQKTVEKVHDLAKYKEKYDFKIEVDGGVNLENAKKLIPVDILCSASTIFKAKDPNVAIQLLKESDNVKQ